MSDYYYYQATASGSDYFESTDILNAVAEQQAATTSVYFPKPIELKLKNDVEFQALDEVMFTPLPLLRKEVLECLLPKNLFNVQYLPVDINKNGKISEAYCLLYVYNLIPCMLENIPNNTNQPTSFSRKLDYPKFSKLPHERKLLFCPKEEPNTLILHQSIRECFTQAEIEWNLSKLVLT